VLSLEDVEHAIGIFDRVSGRHMRFFRAGIVREVVVILEMNSRTTSFLQNAIPVLGARIFVSLKLEEVPGRGNTEENDTSAAFLNRLYIGACLLEPTLNVAGAKRLLKAGDATIKRD